MRIFARPPTFVTVTIGSKKIIFTASKSTKSTFFDILAYKEYPFEQQTISNLTIFLLSYVKKTFETFFTTHKLHHAYTLFSLVPPGIHERIIGLHSEKPQDHHMQQHGESRKKLILDYISLGYNQASEKTYYYVCGITREQLFQYQLLAMMLPLNCIAIIPQRFALLNASTHFFPESTAIGSITNHASLQNYLNYCLLSANFEKKISCAQSLEKKVLMEIFGLLLLGKKIYEQD